MKNCRIHNDIPFEWTILRDGEAEDLSGMAVEVRLEHADGGGARIEYQVEGNVVRGCFRGRHQKKNGPYTIKLTENKGANGMHTVDVADFICLVPRSHMEGGEDSEGIVTSPIKLTSDIAFPADGAGIKSITSTTSDADEGVNVVTILLDTGGTYSFNVKNGSKGEQGDRGATPVITTERKDGVVTIYADGEAVGTVYDGDGGMTAEEKTKLRGIEEGATKTDACFSFNANGTGVQTKNATAGGANSYAEGESASASGKGSHAENFKASASGMYSHAEGSATTAGGTASHAEGMSTTASAVGSHAEGNGTTAGKAYAHAEGLNSNAGGLNSHAEGYGTQTTNDNEHAQGKYNLSTSKKTIHSVGIGASDAERKNAEEIDSDGKKYVIGVGNYDGTNAHAEGVEDLASVINGKQDAISDLENIRSNAQKAYDATYTAESSVSGTCAESGYYGRYGDSRFEFATSPQDGFYRVYDAGELKAGQTLKLTAVSGNAPMFFTYGSSLALATGTAAQAGLTYADGKLCYTATEDCGFAYFGADAALEYEKVTPESNIIGSILGLKTTASTDIVSAINELYDMIQDLKS